MRRLTGHVAVWALAVAVGVTAWTRAATADETVRGLRVDPGNLYGLPGYNPATAAQTLVDDAAGSGANTLFLFAYSPTFGAFYKTSYPDTEVEKGLGSLDFLRQVLDRAHAKGLRVVAALPVNNFKSAWTRHADWRSKTRDGKDYQPDRDSYLLSAWNDGFRGWLKGFADDLLTRYPDVDGVDAVEGVVDLKWDGQPDFNPDATRKFRALYPTDPFEGPKWRQFRAAGLTDLHMTLAGAAHARKKKAFVVQTLAARPDGSLMGFGDVRDGSGFDFDGVMDLAAGGRPDFVAAELIWQQWRAATGNPVFTPDWTGTAARDCVRRAGGRVVPLVHVEVTPFPPEKPTVVPTAEEFERSLKHAVSSGGGATVYEYTLIKNCTFRNFLHLSR
jgi:hypothetical protein